MNKGGPIIIIEDNKADQRILLEIFIKLDFKHELLFFSDGNLALDYLNSTEETPFLILSDINMPNLNGIELRSKIYENKALSLKCVPFLFFSTGVDERAVAAAYSMSVQGFFKKPMNINHLENTIRKIVEYWQECIAPSDYAESNGVVPGQLR